MVAEFDGNTGPISGAGAGCSALGCAGCGGGETWASFPATFSVCDGSNAGSCEASFVSYIVVSLIPQEKEVKHSCKQCMSIPELMHRVTEPRLPPHHCCRSPPVAP